MHDCRYDPVRASKEECLRLEDIKELLGLQVRRLRHRPASTLSYMTRRSLCMVLCMVSYPLLSMQLIGVVPESKAILTATNLGQPVICMDKEDAAQGTRSSTHIPNHHI